MPPFQTPWIKPSDLPGSPRILDLGDGGPPTTIAGQKVHFISSSVKLVLQARPNVHAADALDSLADLSADEFDAAVYAPTPAEAKSRVFEWIDGIHDHLREGGLFYLGGERHRGVESYCQRVNEVFGETEKVRQVGRRRVYRATKIGPRGAAPVDVRQYIDAKIGGDSASFITRAGVFSRDHVDPGSRKLLEAVRIDRGQTVLDVGCGYGAIGIFLARRVASVTMTDVDVRATRCAQENVDRAGVLGEVHTADLFDSVVGRSFDVVVTNPPFHAGHAFAQPFITGAERHLQTGGRVWLVVMRDEPYRKLLLEIFGNGGTVANEGGYSILSAVKKRGSSLGA